MTTHTQTVGQLERKTQNRIVALFRDRLEYEYLGNREDLEGNSNIEEEYLRNYLVSKGYSEVLITSAIKRIKDAADNQSASLYEINKAVYSFLRYGVNVQEALGQNAKTVMLIDWEHPENNHFGIAEEVTIRGNRTKRPDIVLYVNGIALGVIELKRSIVSVSEGIRQNIGNQKSEYIKNFFATSQILMAGNDTEGLRYGTTETTEDYYYEWKIEPMQEAGNKLDRHILELCEKARFLEVIHDFIVFDSGIKKTARHNQYFGVKAAQEYVKRHEGGIIWHTQGSGKSLSMVWLAKWIREHMANARVLILTDRDELDDQIEKVFNGVDEKIYRIKPGEGVGGGQVLVETLGKTVEWLMCSLIHKFGTRGEANDEDVARYIEDIRRQLPAGFEAQGDIFVFVDECHRSHTGRLHDAMKELLPRATFIGFTGTPLLKLERQRDLIRNSNRIWGNYIHTYKYDEAVRDKVVLDLRYDARRIPQEITAQDKIDEYFDKKTAGLTDFAKLKLKERWGTMQALLSSQDRMQRIVFDILEDFEDKYRLASGRGNAMLVASSIYEACRYYEIFQQQGFKKCAAVTSYEPGALNTEDREYGIYRQMLLNFKNDHGEIARGENESETQAFERVVKEMFVKTPGQMQLLIVVDKLLTGFDAPPATFLYVDKNMQDHGLFQAVCRVNRPHGEDKEYGYIVDYRDLFKKLESAVSDYTAGALEGFDKEDVVGLLKDRLEEGKKELSEALETVRALCEPVAPPKDSQSYIRYFCGDTENPYAVKENEMKRVKLYRSVSHLNRVYADLANEMQEAGFNKEQSHAIAHDVKHFEQVRQEIQLASGDYIDLKKYEPAMRMLVDRYISAGESEQLAAFDNMTVMDLIVENGEAAIAQLPDALKRNQDATAEVIVNNVRRLIIDEMPTNPKYFQQMSELLDELVKKRKQEDLEYKKYLEGIINLAKQVRNPETSAYYPASMTSPGKRALYDNLGRDEEKALLLHEAIMAAREDDFRLYLLRGRKIQLAIKRAAPDLSEEQQKAIYEIVVNQHEY